jgi:plasmid segregation protein ParM
MKQYNNLSIVYIENLNKIGGNMKRGIDIGNYSCKEFPNTNIKSLVSTEENILGSQISLEYEGKKYFIGEGSYELELNKSSKENFIPLLLTCIAINSTKDQMFYQVVCGLPINQYRANKEVLEAIVMSKQIKEFKLNNDPRKIIISDFAIYPEGVGAYYSLNCNDDAIIIDIGGRTTDIAYIVNGKLKQSSTITVGTLNIYKDIADRLNAQYCLDIDMMFAERILRKGHLEVDGLETDLSFVVEILKKNFIKINDDLTMKFPARTEKIILVGGGAELFNKAFKNRYQNAYLAENALFANAIGFRKVGEMLWN